MKPFQNKEVERAFDAFDSSIKRELLAIRELIFETAAEPGIGTPIEALRWGQPAYLTERPKTGTTIRLAPFRTGYALFVPCSTTLIEGYRQTYGDALRYEKSRAIYWERDTHFNRAIVRECIRAALRYHSNRD